MQVLESFPLEPFGILPYLLPYKKCIFLWLLASRPCKSGHVLPYYRSLCPLQLPFRLPLPTQELKRLQTSSAFQNLIYQQIHVSLHLLLEISLDASLFTSVLMLQVNSQLLPALRFLRNVMPLYSSIQETHIRLSPTVSLKLHSLRPPRWGAKEKDSHNAELLQRNHFLTFDIQPYHSQHFIPSS